MKRLSLSVKLTLISILISGLILVLLYFGFTHIVKQHLLKVEKEKAEIIAKTIGPMIAMNAFLGLSDENVQLATQTKQNSDVVGVAITIDDKILIDDKLASQDGFILIEELIYDPLTADAVGKLEIQYLTGAYKEAANEINQNVLYQLGYISIAFLIFGLLVRYFMRPLGLIAQIVSNYKPGEKLAFSGVRMEPEISAISNAFHLMLKTIDEHNLLLERYKLSIDESSIVSRIDPSGRITYVNDEFCKVSGYERQELINSSCNLVQSSEISSEFYQNIWKHLYSKKIWKGTLQNESKNGEPYFVKSTIVPILDESGNILEFVTIQHDVTQIIKQQEQISRQVTDPVTGLKNRVKLIEDLQSIDKCSLAFLSVDNYDVIKDYYGYETGLDIIVSLSGRIKSLLHNDHVNLCKLASNEYAILSTDYDLDLFYSKCRELIEIIEDSTIHVGGEYFDIHMSAGISNTLEKIMLYASLALKQAKNTNVPVLIYETSGNLIQQYEKNILWTKKLKEALQEDRIAVFAQAIVDSSTMQVNKYECLVRLIDEDGKIVSPFFFLDVAKKTKLYHKITKTVFSKTLAAMKQISDVEFSINLSPDDLMHNETMDFISEAISQSNCAERIVLEIVESEEIEELNAVSNSINKLKNLGCKVAIDDFGTGYSNFSYLMQINADFIKVDGSLIKDIHQNENSQVIAQTILQFASQLELKTVAEFVHNEKVMDEVRSMGFDYLQGFHLDEPKPLDEIVNG